MSASAPGSVMERTKLDAAVVAAQLQELVDDRAVVALELAGAAVHRGGVGVLLHVGDQAALAVGAGGAEGAARDALERCAADAAGQADLLGDVDDGADGGVLALVARDEDDALLAGRVDRERDVHGGEDDGVVQRDEQQLLGHAVRSLVRLEGRGAQPYQRSESVGLRFPVRLVRRAPSADVPPPGALGCCEH